MADVDEREVQAVINRGGRAAEAGNGESDALRRVQLRLYSSQIANIDSAIEKLKRIVGGFLISRGISFFWRLSRRSWIVNSKDGLTCYKHVAPLGLNEDAPYAAFTHQL